MGWRPGPVGGPGGIPPLGSFTGLRSRTLISFLTFFVLSSISVFLLRFICFGCCSLGTHFCHSLMSCVKFCDALRGKFGFFYRRKLRRLSRAGEGSEDSCGYCLDFLQKVTKRRKVFAAAEDKAFVSFVERKLPSIGCDDFPVRLRESLHLIMPFRIG